jgi:hypothetical protein
MIKLQPPETDRTESVIQAEIRRAVGGLPDVRIWRNNTAQLISLNKQELLRLLRSGRIQEAIKMVEACRPIQAGLAVGSADLIGIVGDRGRFLSIEVKSETGRPTTEQKAWAAMVERFGGVAGPDVRSVDEAMELVERARTR